jgi:gas vesicle protein
VKILPTLDENNSSSYNDLYYFSFSVLLIHLPLFIFLAGLLKIDTIIHLNRNCMSMKLIFSCLAAGAAIGMLMAPENGTTTRQKISNTIEDLKDRLYKVRAKGADELEELKEIFSREITGLKDDTRTRILEILQATKQAGTRVKEQMAV